MQKQAKDYNIPIKRWPATYGKDITYNELRALGIGHAMVRSDRFDDEHKKSRNLGIIGCFITTRRLLQHLNGLKRIPDSYGHMILEDDIVLPPDLMSSEGLIAKLTPNLPRNWDLLYLGIWHPTGEEVVPGLIKLESADQVNVGTFAYIVRHGSLGKIINWLK